ncbi:GntR family transcriptional regulator [Pararhizobium sp. YC-54]|uniref:GntR family transcriptional regulator n=1 Tax=Pararhizobium sp. YC-54 TaxID=2986920 RepID=UPI0021F75BD8|nr:GntR family transcriptional regulator [Pararhizobium sp. YC-54]MCW0001535.1 GntR family transcriptional regulator [Pararhizobium sp. YC-54]
MANRTSKSVTPGLIEKIAEQIHSKIASGEYKPGERLKQELLAEQFGVSRTPIREALSRLEATGIIQQMGAKRSAVVASPSARDVREIYQVRAELEGFAVQLASRWITDEQLHALRRSHEAFVSAAERLKETKRQNTAASKRETINDADREAAQNWFKTNACFHKIIIEASCNAALARTVNEIASGYLRNIMLSSLGETTTHRMNRNIATHADILDALERHDGERARRFMTEHVIEAGEFVAAWFERQER